MDFLLRYFPPDGPPEKISIDNIEFLGIIEFYPKK